MGEPVVGWAPGLKPLPPGLLAGRAAAFSRAEVPAISSPVGSSFGPKLRGLAFAPSVSPVVISCGSTPLELKPPNFVPPKFGRV